MKKNFKIIGEWHDSLIWCPSQCKLNISYKGIDYQIYLRWRWENPWTCALITINTKEWVYPETFSYWSDDDDLDKIKKDAIEQIKKYLFKNG